MKIRTNLSPTELLTISKGLKKAAESTEEFVPENKAEKMMVDKVEHIFFQAVNNLQKEFVRIFKDKG